MIADAKVQARFEMYWCLAIVPFFLYQSIAKRNDEGGGGKSSFMNETSLGKADRFRAMIGGILLPFLSIVFLELGEFGGWFHHEVLLFILAVTTYIFGLLAWVPWIVMKLKGLSLGAIVAVVFLCLVSAVVHFLMLVAFDLLLSGFLGFDMTF